VRLKSAQRISPGDWRIQLQLGLCYQSKEQFVNAAALIEQAVQAEPDLTAAHVALATVYFRLGRKADGQREKKIVAELERKQQEELVREYSTGSLIDESSQQSSGEPAH
jgi:Tfp pilus assembly protein PilF